MEEPPEGYTASLTIRVPRAASRSTLEECRRVADSVAAKHGLTDEPMITRYDNFPGAWGGRMKDPQGWTFTWPLPSE